jgi:hypothetical protein
MSKHHNIKIELPYYYAAKRGDKNFEIRKNDRRYEVGDTVLIHPTHDEGLAIGNPPLFGEITYVTDFEQKRDFVVFGVKYARFKA